MKILYRSLLILFILLSQSKESYCQDTTKFFISYDFIKGIINEPSLTFGYYLTPHHFVTLSLGYTYDHKSIREAICSLSPNQDTYPFMVYQGPTVRTSYAYQLGPTFYLGADFFYKYLQYDDHEFLNSESGGEVSFIRNEKAKVFGGHYNIGFMKLLPDSRLLINPSIGLGLTYKHRVYTTKDVHRMYDFYGEIPQEGTFTKNMWYTSLLFNLNFGLNLLKKK